jgi:hypothetical protein
MRKFKITFSDEAYNDLSDLVDVITFQYKSPITAFKYGNELKAKIKNLEQNADIFKIETEEFEKQNFERNRITTENQRIMEKTIMLKEIKKRLPKHITVKDNTKFDFTIDEYLSILSWIKYFNCHYENNDKEKRPDIQIPVISKRIFIDLGLYEEPHLIYIQSISTKSTKQIIYNYKL